MSDRTAEWMEAADAIMGLSRVDEFSTNADLLKFYNDKSLLNTAKEMEKKSSKSSKVTDAEKQAFILTANAIDKKFAECRETFMLSSPQLLTVYRSGKYSKEAHMGCEDFQPMGAYVGKSNKIILTFKPVMTASYTHMEMSISDAETNLGGFIAYSHENLSGCWKSVDELEVAKANAARDTEIQSQTEAYKDIGFGSW